MKICNFGSMNIDNVYRVHHIVRPGETISSLGYRKNPGGKGLNQSIALAKAGMDVWHAGIAGMEDGDFLLDVLAQAGVHTDLIGRCEGRNGHCIIQVDDEGQNCIFLFGGSNHAVTDTYIDGVMEQMQQKDLLLLQNEISGMDRILKRAAEKDLYVILNPSPMDDALLSLDLGCVSMFLLNEVEGADLAGTPDPDGIISVMHEKYPDAEIVLTLGSEGSVYSGRYGTFRQKAFPVRAVDTTAAGDTFTGYFIREYFETRDPAGALALASRASAIAVTRPGAASSIPLRAEVEAAVEN